MIPREICAQHIPVLVNEALFYLNCQSEGVYVDGTVGLGGHSEKILEYTSAQSTIIGIDRDPECLVIAQERLSRFGNRVLLAQGNFRDIDEIVKNAGYTHIQGILLDIGMSSYHLQPNKRGFSFNDFSDAPLDMRFDMSSGPTAGDIINHYPVHDLERIFRDYGEERWSRRIARAIGRERQKEKIMTVGHLVAIILSSISKRGSRWRIHPATRIFQALRIEVNRELDNLKSALESAKDCLDKGGRLCVISFHSLEDRIVKNKFKETAEFRSITPKPLTATREEISKNPRARSAKLRAAERC
ncbi:MAG: 16S rRNA (cytosine(1402)-N(4))-methyltransferase RsmH [bacterium]